MKYKRIKGEDGSIEYRIEGDFQTFFFDRLKKQVDEDVAEGAASYFRFDLSKTERIDSMAISILVVTGRYNAAKGKKLFVKNPSEIIRQIVHAADLNFIEFI